MNKYVKLVGIVAVVAALALVSATAAFAQTPTPPAGSQPVMGRGFGGRGPGAGSGFLAVDQDAMHAAIAEALGISVEELDAALAEGKTLYILAQELGVDFADVQAAMQAAHEAALAQAVADGLISQEQADWILSHRAQMGGAVANGSGSMGRGARSGGFGGNAGECPYTTP
jgi:hypothetical protein